MRRESSISSSCERTRLRCVRATAGTAVTVASLAAVLASVSSSTGLRLVSSRRGARAVLGTFTILGGWDAWKESAVSPRRMAQRLARPEASRRVPYIKHRYGFRHAFFVLSGGLLP